MRRNCAKTITIIILQESPTVTAIIETVIPFYRMTSMLKSVVICHTSLHVLSKRRVWCYRYVRKIFSLPARAPYTPLACLCEPRHDKTKASIHYNKKMNAYMHLLR